MILKVAAAVPADRWGGSSRRMDAAALRRWGPLAAVVGLLALSALAAAHSTPQLSQLDTGDAGDDTGPAAQPTAPVPAPPTVDQTQATGEVGGDLPDWLGAVALTAVAAAVLIALAIVARALLKDRVATRAGRRLRPAAAPEPNAADVVVAALNAGLLELSDADADPRRAVIACWVRLEQAAAAAGTARRPDDTATDLVTRLLAEQHVSAAVLGPFAAVYREARYATRPVDEQTRRDARAALHRLRAELGAEVPW